MCRQKKPITKTLSVRISLMVVSLIAVFLLSTFIIIFYYSQKVLREEALQEAKQTLESTILQIDNVLLSAEQASGNDYWDLLQHLNQPEQMFNYGRQLLNSNPYITGCAIAFEPYFYPEQGEYFMAYVHRSKTGDLKTSNSPIIQATTFGNKPYTQQIWYYQPRDTRRAYWLNPIKEDSTDITESIITFSLPIFQQDKVVGVMAVDVSLQQLSQIVEEAKPSPNSYAILIGSDGSYIVHPDKTKFSKKDFSTKSEFSEIQSIVKDMMKGKTDYKSVTIGDMDAYVFYKPFKRVAVPGRTMENLGWSIAIVYPEDDIFGEYDLLLTIALIIAIVGLLLLFIFSRVVTHRQILPLRHLAASVQSIAEGNYNTPICDCHQIDEVGRLQENFQAMQQSLANRVGELQQLTATLQEQGRITKEAYEQAKEADRMKIAFLHNMTNQMLAPAQMMSDNVSLLCDQNQIKTTEEVGYIVKDIQQQGQTITELLNQLLKVSREQETIEN